MWTTLSGISSKRRRRLTERWSRAGPEERERRWEHLRLDASQVRVLRQWIPRCRDLDLRRRLLTVLHWINGWPVGFIAEAFCCARSTVYRTIGRCEAEGLAGLIDGRKENGPRKVDERYLETLEGLVRGSPLDHGESRPTWTRELLGRVAARKTGVRVHVSTLSRVLERIGARLGRSRPVVRCPWSSARRQRRLRELRKLVRDLAPDEVALWEDEVDVDLNPKIGRDWMMRGQQKEIVTPGKNVKQYIAGAMDARTRQMVWVSGPRKTSALFVRLLFELTGRYRKARVIHVIVDNYVIHASQITQRAVAAFGGKVVLHFLPPYCPNDNPIERVWEDFHANVTRNHRYKSMRGLMAAAEEWLRQRNADRRRSAKAAA